MFICNVLADVYNTLADVFREQLRFSCTCGVGPIPNEVPYLGIDLELGSILCWLEAFPQEFLPPKPKSLASLYILLPHPCALSQHVHFSHFQQHYDYYTADPVALRSLGPSGIAGI